MIRGFTSALAIIASLSFWGSSTVQAQQVGPGPGFANVQQTKGDLLSVVGRDHGRGAVIAYHQGYMVTMPEAPASKAGSILQTFMWDISDPRNPKGTRIMGGANSHVAAHGYWKEGNKLFLKPEANIFFEGGTARSSSPPQIHYGEGGGRGLMFQPWAMSMYWTYGATNRRGGLSLRGRQLASWDHVGQSNVTGHPFLMGNLLIYASDQAYKGAVIYDITPSLQNPGTPPKMLSVTNNGAGGYWPALWGEGEKLYLLYPNQARNLFILDISDPTNINDKLIFNANLKDTFKKDGWVSLEYAQFQDNFAFVDKFKINMNTVAASGVGAVEQVISPSEKKVDLSTTQFSLPIGNLLVSGGIVHNQGIGIWAHQAEPDKKGPYVGYHIPKKGQTNYHPLAPISLFIAEHLEIDTISNGRNFIVRPINNGTAGQAVSGRIIFNSDQILTFTPDNPLAANTTYEVHLPAGGIKDAAGNGMQQYTFRFSTGGTVDGAGQAETPPPAEEPVVEEPAESEEPATPETPETPDTPDASEGSDGETPPPVVEEPEEPAEETPDTGSGGSTGGGTVTSPPAEEPEEPVVETPNSGTGNGGSTGGNTGNGNSGGGTATPPVAEQPEEPTTETPPVAEPTEPEESEAPDEEVEEPDAEEATPPPSTVSDLEGACILVQ